ncbi:MAG: hypothetical protein PVG99_06705 [Desulfobacteraceae bacterium]
MRSRSKPLRLQVIRQRRLFGLSRAWAWRNWIKRGWFLEVVLMEIHFDGVPEQAYFVCPVLC